MALIERVLNTNELLNQTSQQVYALLDACDDSRMPIIVDKLGSAALSLYSGKAKTSLAHVAPYLAQLTNEWAKWIFNELCDDPWGYFLLAEKTCTHAHLRRHLRQFLIVRTPDSREVFFRFYDPRIVLPFLRSSTDAELVAFFGPIKSIATCRDAETCQVFELGNAT
jgi:hypothetical protein